MSSQEPTAELELLPPPETGEAPPALFDARLIAALVAQDMETALKAWRSEPDPHRAVEPRESWLGAPGGRRAARVAAQTRARAIAAYAGAAGLVGIAIGLLLAQAHHPPPGPGPSPAPVVAATAPPAGQTSASAQTSAQVQAPSPAAQEAAPVPRPDPIGRLYGELEARRSAVPRRRHAPRAWGGDTCARAGAGREACLSLAVDEADRELRRSYQLAVERRIGAATLNSYREAWARLRRQDAADPQALVEDYRGLSAELRRAASLRRRAGRRVVHHRRVQEHPWYY